MTHQVKPKKITTVKEVWIHQTREEAFHRDIQTPTSIFDEIRGLDSRSNTVFVYLLNRNKNYSSQTEKYNRQNLY